MIYEVATPIMTGKSFLADHPTETLLDASEVCLRYRESFGLHLLILAGYFPWVGFEAVPTFRAAFGSVHFHLSFQLQEGVKINTPCGRLWSLLL